MPVAEQNRRGGGKRRMGQEWWTWPQNSSIRWHQDLSLTLLPFWLFQGLKSTRRAITEICKHFVHAHSQSHMWVCMNKDHDSTHTAYYSTPISFSKEFFPQLPLWKPQEPFEQSGSLNLWWRAARLYDPQWLKLMPKLSQKGIWGWRETCLRSPKWTPHFVQVKTLLMQHLPLWSGAFISWKDCSKTKTPVRIIIKTWKHKKDAHACVCMCVHTHTLLSVNMCICNKGNDCFTCWPAEFWRWPDSCPDRLAAALASPMPSRPRHSVDVWG